MEALPEKLIMIKSGKKMKNSYGYHKANPYFESSGIISNYIALNLTNTLFMIGKIL